MKKAIFLDKDGTLIEDVPYNVDPAKIKLQHDALEALQLLQRNNYLFILVSNQSGVALGYFRETDLQPVGTTINKLLLAGHVSLDAFYYCPHHANGQVPEYTQTCTCRKPEPGMLLQAASEYEIDLARSWMIGDILDDVEAGKKAGCKTVLLDNGNETMWERYEEREPTFIAHNLKEAAHWILWADAL